MKTWRPKPYLPLQIHKKTVYSHAGMNAAQLAKELNLTIDEFAALGAIFPPPYAGRIINSGYKPPFKIERVLIEDALIIFKSLKALNAHFGTELTEEDRFLQEGESAWIIKFFGKFVNRYEEKDIISFLPTQNEN